MIFYFLLICIGSFIAGRLILGELRKERRDYIAITPQELEPIKTVISQTAVINDQPVLLDQTDAQLQERINKVEALLAEKNIELTKLQNILEAERKHKAASCCAGRTHATRRYPCWENAKRDSDGTR